MYITLVNTTHDRLMNIEPKPSTPFMPYLPTVDIRGRLSHYISQHVSIRTRKPCLGQHANALNDLNRLTAYGFKRFKMRFNNSA